MRRSVSVAMTLALACAFWAAGCYRSAPKVAVPPPPADAPAPEKPGTTAPPATTGAGPGPAAESAGSAFPAISGVPQGAETTPPPSEREPSPGVEGSLPPPAPPEPALPANAPSFAREKEELVYRVEFLGLTMGYARFHFRGIVRIDGKETYHLTVRAWTSDLLSVFYPMNDTIEYYLDVETLAPIRQEFTNGRKEDDIAYYNQQTGQIVYRYKKNGKVRKQVEAVPGVYDPVSVVYYFRTRDLASEGPARSMYAGRKLWEVSAKPLGVETIRTDRGQFDTVLIEPVLRREGTQEHRGNLRVWMTRDERHVPVRLYAKFKKVRIWTLVGELLPDRQGG